MTHLAAFQALSTRPDNRPFAPTRQHGNETQGFFSRLLDQKRLACAAGRPSAGDTSQVQVHLESQRRQYDLVDEARRHVLRDVEVIDDDLGRSASGTVARPGFEKLVAGLRASEVGAVLASTRPASPSTAGTGISCAASSTPASSTWLHAARPDPSHFLMSAPPRFRSYPGDNFSDTGG
jgi:hypothetical protein